jgi:hypothetical protein
MKRTIFFDDSLPGTLRVSDDHYCQHQNPCSRQVVPLSLKDGKPGGPEGSTLQQTLTACKTSNRQ